ncbi:TPR repeat-containing protein YfgC precursor [compost metagenome]
MTVVWTGQLYDGVTSRPSRVHLEPKPDGLMWRLDEGENATWPYAEVRVLQGRWPGQPVRLQHGRQAIVVADARILAAMATAAPGAGFQPALGRGALAGRAAASLLGVGILVAGFVQWGNPAMASLLAPHVPVAWEEKLGQLVVDRMAPVEKRCTTTARVEQVEQVLKSLLAAEPSPFNYKVIILESDEVNAFAAPGGYIVIHEALLNRTRSAEELAGVLAHEVQHIHQRHVTRHMLEAFGAQAVATVVMGDTGLGTMALLLGVLHYGQALETEADREGMRLMQAAKLDPRAMVRFFREELADDDAPSGWQAWLSTHPELADRVRRLEGMAKEARYTPRPIKLEYNWMFVNAGCETLMPQAEAEDLLLE